MPIFFLFLEFFLSQPQAAHARRALSHAHQVSQDVSQLAQARAEVIAAPSTARGALARSEDARETLFFVAQDAPVASKGCSCT